MSQIQYYVNACQQFSWLQQRVKLPYKDRITLEILVVRVKQCLVMLSFCIISMILLALISYLSLSSSSQSISSLSVSSSDSEEDSEDLPATCLFCRNDSFSSVHVMDSPLNAVMAGADILFGLNTSIRVETNHVAASASFDVVCLLSGLLFISCFTFKEKIFFLGILLKMFYEIVLCLMPCYMKSYLLKQLFSESS